MNSNQIYSVYANACASEEIRTVMIRAGALLAIRGYTQRNGANDAEAYFENGALLKDGNVETFLPWNGFNDYHIGSQRYVGDQLAGRRMSARYLRGYRNLKREQQLIVARLSYVLLGGDLKNHASFVLAYSDDKTIDPRNAKCMSYRYLLKLCNSYGIPVYNLAIEEHLSLAIEWTGTAELCS